MAKTAGKKESKRAGGSRSRPRSRADRATPSRSTGNKLRVPIRTEVEIWKTKDLRPYERNPRGHSAQQIDELASSIRRFGFVIPILIDPEAGIIAGEGRLKAARKLRLAKVPVLICEQLTPEQIRAYRIADNRLAERATWIEDFLEEELAALRASGEDLSGVGFTAEEIARILDDVSGGDYEDLDEESRSLEGREEVTIALIVPRMERERVLEWISQGGRRDSVSLGEALLSRIRAEEE